MLAPELKLSKPLSAQQQQQQQPTWWRPSRRASLPPAGGALPSGARPLCPALAVHAPPAAAAEEELLLLSPWPRAQVPGPGTVGSRWAGAGDTCLAGPDGRGDGRGSERLPRGRCWREGAGQAGEAARSTRAGIRESPASRPARLGCRAELGRGGVLGRSQRSARSGRAWEQCTLTARGALGKTGFAPLLLRPQVIADSHT